MKLILKSVSAIILSLSALTALAAPTHLITHNNTSEQSNAYIAGIPSPYPTAANSTGKVFWNLVRMACYNHSADGTCTAEIRMATNTPTPIVVGNLTLNLTTGDINPKSLTANGYTLTVNGPGETTISKN